MTGDALLHRIGARRIETAGVDQGHVVPVDVRGRVMPVAGHAGLVVDDGQLLAETVKDDQGCFAVQAFSGIGLRVVVCSRGQRGSAPSSFLTVNSTASMRRK